MDERKPAGSKPLTRKQRRREQQRLANLEKRAKAQAQQQPLPAKAAKKAPEKPAQVTIQLPSPPPPSPAKPKHWLKRTWEKVPFGVKIFFGVLNLIGGFGFYLSYRPNVLIEVTAGADPSQPFSGYFTATNDSSVGIFDGRTDMATVAAFSESGQDLHFRSMSVRFRYDGPLKGIVPHETIDLSPHQKFSFEFTDPPPPEANHIIVEAKIYYRVWYWPKTIVQGYRFEAIKGKGGQVMWLAKAGHREKRYISWFEDGNAGGFIPR